MLEYFSLFNRIEWALIIIAFAVSAKSANIRWLTGTLIVLKTIDVLVIDIILQWGGFYYLAISFYDVVIIAMILNRQKTASWIAGLNIPVLSRLALGSAQYYKLTSNEICLILLYLASILVNLLSLSERLVRKYTEFEPMFFYNIYPEAKLTLTTLSILILCSVAINGANNLYRDRKGQKL
ncbi:hypothetical protein [Shewanella woodyi]|uniref:Uncharacterized protein n=1 Tax=Shewanella woodyi (strain ATCC 51908 / MS32) TaxID=392500 RepID=B1KQG9_SHEWM|nr:hypothetical protein [Shewanella woodyi]ACA86208.1 hypothetical protein Swoo_1924 [Shewanella woodyi ATCC 51908]